MISYLNGEIKFIEYQSVSVLSNGIGWEVHTFIPEQYTVGQLVEFYVYTHIRESDISLWGFKSSSELKCFKLLLSVSGVGPKTAQALVGDRGVDQICFAIQNNDTNVLKVPGVGLKTAQKIVIELKGKISSLSYDPENITKQPTLGVNDFSELFEALSSLGYKYNDIKIFVDKLEIKTELPTEELIKMFLRQ